MDIIAIGFADTTRIDEYGVRIPDVVNFCQRDLILRQLKHLEPFLDGLGIITIGDVAEIHRCFTFKDRLVDHLIETTGLTDLRCRIMSKGLETLLGKEAIAVLNENTECRIDVLHKTVINEQ